MAVSKVRKCGITGCVYNVDNTCLAGAITVSDENCPRCDTFIGFSGSSNFQESGQIAEVGACKVSSCVYNSCMNCQAVEIVVDRREDEPRCVTFQPCCIAGILAYDSLTRLVSDEAGSSLPEIFIG